MTDAYDGTEIEQCEYLPFPLAVLFPYWDVAIATNSVTPSGITKVFDLLVLAHDPPPTNEPVKIPSSVLKGVNVSAPPSSVGGIKYP